MFRAWVIYLASIHLVAVSTTNKLEIKYQRQGTCEYEVKPFTSGLHVTRKSDAGCPIYVIVIPSDDTNNTKGNELKSKPYYACEVERFLMTTEDFKILDAVCATTSPKIPSSLKGLTVINLDTAGYQMVRWETPMFIEPTCTITYILKQSINGKEQWGRHLLQDDPILIGGLEPGMEYEYAVQVKPGWLSTPSDAAKVAKRTPAAISLSNLRIDLSTGRLTEDQLANLGICRILPSDVKPAMPKMSITNALNEKAQILEFEPLPSTSSTCNIGVRVKVVSEGKEIMFLSKGPHVIDGLRLKELYIYDVCFALAKGQCVTTKKRFSKTLDYTKERLNPVWFQMSTTMSKVTVYWEIPAFSEQYLTHFNITVRNRENIPFCPIAVQKGILKYRYIFSGLVPDDQFIVILRGFEKDKLRMEVHGGSNDGKYTEPNE